jgi:lysozyme family protein
MTAIDYAAQIADCEARWAKCEILPSRLKEVMTACERLVAATAKVRYQAVEAATGVLWQNVAVIAMRESDANFKCQLGQGDPLNEVSRHVPKGMGPYLDHPSDGPGHDAWHRCAVDTLQNTPPYAARWRVWTIGGSLCLFIQYNGEGYWLYHGHEPSPYDWGGTNQEVRGKYTSDGSFSASLWDTQLGCAALLKGMMQLDPSIKFAEAA